MLPTPEIKALQRLQIQNGLLINAERWMKSHEYHRQRQNIHYQSLNQPGIICGLGVSLIETPKDIPSQYNDGRWLQIQPGIAIDVAGNPIIVAEPIDFHIAADIADTQPRLIYIVLSYVDPDKLVRQQTSEFEKETFRIDEKTSPPTAFEVEVCQILLQPGLVALENPTDVFFPGVNCLDLRSRKIACSRPKAFVRAASLQSSTPEVANSIANLSYLLQATNSLYPSLQGYEKIDKLTWTHLENTTIANTYDLLFTTGNQIIQLNEKELSNLKIYLDKGGVLLIESPTNAVDRLESIIDLTDQLGTPLEDLRRQSRNHPLRSQPFLFAGLPRDTNQQAIQLLTAGGIILTIGDLSAAWGLDDKLSLPRETIRTAQELGINILNFAWQRRQMTQLMQQQTNKESSQESSKEPLKNILKKLE
jgi:Domain of unknown function (DUF4159)